MQVAATLGTDAPETDTLFLQEAKRILEHLGSNGATMGNVNKSKFESVPLVRPPAELLEQFNYLVEPMFTSILRSARQIQNLRRTRDLLSPRLLSGELAVK